MAWVLAEGGSEEGRGGDGGREEGEEKIRGKVKKENVGDRKKKWKRGGCGTLRKKIWDGV